MQSLLKSKLSNSVRIVILGKPDVACVVPPANHICSGLLRASLILTNFEYNFIVLNAISFEIRTK